MYIAIKDFSFPKFNITVKSEEKFEMTEEQYQEVKIFENIYFSIVEGKEVVDTRPLNKLEVSKRLKEIDGLDLPLEKKEELAEEIKQLPLSINAKKVFEVFKFTVIKETPEVQ